MIRNLIAAVLTTLALAAQANVDINKATQAELEAVKGIGTAMSTRIIEERSKGTFKDWSDVITRVKGVGDGNAAKFSDAGLTVAGAPFGGAAPKAPAKAAPKASEKVADKAAEKTAAKN